MVQYRSRDWGINHLYLVRWRGVNKDVLQGRESTIQVRPRSGITIVPHLGAIDLDVPQRLLHHTSYISGGGLDQLRGDLERSKRPAGLNAFADCLVPCRYNGRSIFPTASSLNAGVLRPWLVGVRRVDGFSYDLYTRRFRPGLANDVILAHSLGRPRDADLYRYDYTGDRGRRRRTD